MSATAASVKHGQQRSDIGACELESLVIISGPCSALPERCERRNIPSGLTYRPVVEAHDGAERIYSKYNLPLFEIIGEDGNASSSGDNSEGATGKAENAAIASIGDCPAAAVLRRRRRGRQGKIAYPQRACNGAKAAVGRPNEPEEDLSDAHYRKLHRKPEYVEKRVRNREIELYQYARWQEGQRMESVRSRLMNHLPLHLAANDGTGSNSDAGTQTHSRCASPISSATKGTDGEAAVAAAAADRIVDSTNPHKDKLGASDDTSIMINDTLKQLDSIRPPPQSMSGRRRKPKIGMRKELASLLDSMGYQEARARSSRGSPSVATPSTRSGSPDIANNGPNTSGSVADTTLHPATSSDAKMVLLDSECITLQPPLSELEQKTARSGGEILEQLLIQASRLPPASLVASSAVSSAANTPAESDNEDEVGTTADSTEDIAADDGDDRRDSDADISCCCPRDFSLPQRLYGHMIKQREQ
ncbi:hypothetical protein GQ54DRAFT_298345 [Martensiomyces pterosporus]|nr:hypothetical protein GQ54DRAFT_298345 [Martensiomyces pterosporus]